MTDPYVIHHGDCLDVLPTLPDCSVDAVVTDPPYGLSATDTDHVVEALTAWLTGDRAFIPTIGGGFMGKAWDEFVPPPAVWDECYRVLKPGGHVLCFAGTRTHDLMSLAIRLAGFEKRDSIAWLYGSGFPKSLDVSKAIDKAAPRAGMFESFALHFAERWAASGMRRRDFVPHFPHYKNAESVMAQLSNWKLAKNVPSVEDFEILRGLLGLSGDWQTLIDRVEAEREVVGTRNGLNGSGFGNVGHGLASAPDAVKDTAPATDDARTWQGWGTALKPAFEPIVVARKPLVGTVAGNVLAHGTGALNIDGCRIEGGARPLIVSKSEASTGILGDGLNGSSHGGETTAGRWPANVVLDEDQAAALDEMSGVLHSQDPRTRNSTSPRSGIIGFADGGLNYADTGGASRFFYTAKATSAERPRVNGIAHPTVKPLSLMRWLVRLVTPPGGTVLEPFAGSGTTVEACQLEGFRCIAIEREVDYLPLITSRLRQGVLDFEGLA